ncbi:RNA polymerase sigma factor [Sphingobacterium tabacisoli]|uniref:RNA polymerase sigma factor n=1 Tax=Sphingobacterium tabacisoli TaxID=2044855 RepID=A0ABW5L7J0_9SPHI|nr:sigma-70 family RNA polymerase sigma factor [Sphingobacterium tabacisoli]
MNQIKHSDCSDEQLFDLVKLGDEIAYQHLYDRFFYLLFAQAKRKVNTKEDAQDLTQDIFMNLWKKRSKINIEGKVVHFLFASLRNSIINFYIKTKKQGEREELFQYFNNLYEETTSRTIHKNELERIIQNEIDALPLKMKQIYLLSRNQELSHKEIAELMALSELTVKKQVANALRILKQKIHYVLFSTF